MLLVAALCLAFTTVLLSRLGRQNLARPRWISGSAWAVVAVNPNATEVAGVPCYPDVASVRGELDGVVIMVPAPSAAGVVEACAARGLRRVWLFRGAGGVGSVSDDAIEVARLHDLDVIVGACPLMFLEPVGWFHRMHRAVRRRRGQLVAVAGRSVSAVT